MKPTEVEQALDVLSERIKILEFQHEAMQGTLTKLSAAIQKQKELKVQND